MLYFKECRSSSLILERAADEIMSRVSEGATPYHMIFIYIKAMGFAWLSWKCSHFNLKQTLSDIFQFTHHMVRLILHSINIKRNLKSWYVLQHGQDILKIRTSTNSFWWRWWHLDEPVVTFFQRFGPSSINLKQCEDVGFQMFVFCIFVTFFILIKTLLQIKVALMNTLSQPWWH